MQICLWRKQPADDSELAARKRLQRQRYLAASADGQPRRELCFPGRDTRRTTQFLSCSRQMVHQ